jgi:hypothetical protein
VNSRQTCPFADFGQRFPKPHRIDARQIGDQEPRRPFRVCPQPGQQRHGDAQDHQDHGQAAAPHAPEEQARAFQLPRLLPLLMLLLAAAFLRRPGGLVEFLGVGHAAEPRQEGLALVHPLFVHYPHGPSPALALLHLGFDVVREQIVLEYLRLFGRFQLSDGSHDVIRFEPPPPPRGESYFLILRTRTTSGLRICHQSTNGRMCE